MNHHKTTSFKHHICSGTYHISAFKKLCLIKRTCLWYSIIMTFTWFIYRYKCYVFIVKYINIIFPCLYIQMQKLWKCKVTELLMSVIGPVGVTWSHITNSAVTTQRMNCCSYRTKGFSACDEKIIQAGISNLLTHSVLVWPYQLAKPLQNGLVIY